jgi:hypothetical protein
MATGQLADLPGFVEVLGDYDLGVAAVVWILAITLVLGEVVAGVLLLSGGAGARTMGAVAALTVAIAWSVLALSAFARGEAIQNCGCFGVYLAQPLRWLVLVEDAEFLALGGWVLFRERKHALQGRDRYLTGFPEKTVKGVSAVRSPQAR